MPKESRLGEVINWAFKQRPQQTDSVDVDRLAAIAERARLYVDSVQRGKPSSWDFTD